jgi:hypothetical protein
MNDTQKHIFVLGTGRSGTCWMGEILGSHPQIRGFVEPRPVFELVTQVAVDPAREERLLDRIFDEYRRLFELAKPFHFADKTHPVLWLAEKVATQFPNSSFVAMRRAVEPTVASMLRHSGVRRWCEQWESYPAPNRFLGISYENLEWYRNASLEQRCAARWYSHRNEIRRLAPVLGDRLLTVDYEDLVSRCDENLEKVRQFLELSEDFPALATRTGSLNKWKSQLSTKDVSGIESAVAYLADTVGCP